MSAAVTPPLRQPRGSSSQTWLGWLWGAPAWHAEAWGSIPGTKEEEASGYEQLGLRTVLQGRPPPPSKGPG